LLFAVVFNGEFVRGERSGNTASQRAGCAQGWIGFAVANEHIASGCCRGSFAAVNRDDGPVWAADQDEAAAADSGIVRVHYSEREGDGDGSVNGVAAVFEYV
jgi:hypothetical protein